MTSNQLEALVLFMEIVLYALYPCFDEYPIEEMKKVKGTKGCNFQNTEYEDKPDLIAAFFINECMENIENENEKE